MATKTFFGVFRSDAGFGEQATYTAGNSFSSNLITSITVDLGADDTIFDGDDAPDNEIPNDLTQTYDDGAGTGAFAYDFTVTVTGSDGQTYEIAIFDYDINNDGNFNETFEANPPRPPEIGAEDAGENAYFMAFLGTVPPPGITLTTTGTITSNQPSLPIASVVCFTRGSLIETEFGQIAIEELKPEHKVLTRDHGLKPIRWIGSSKVDAIDLAMNPHLKPIRIRAHALGDGHPFQDLLVSPQHRLLVRSPIAKRMFDSSEVLLPAKKLLNIDGIDIQSENTDGLEYFHILFDQHEVISANGAWAESLFTGPQALNAVSTEARAEIETLFPEICQSDYEPAAARHIPKTGKQMETLVRRHLENGKPLYAS